MMDVLSLRRHFPALQRTVRGRTPIFLDGPGGTQVPQGVIDAVGSYLSHPPGNYNNPCGGWGDEAEAEVEETAGMGPPDEKNWAGRLYPRTGQEEREKCRKVATEGRNRLDNGWGRCWRVARIGRARKIERARKIDRAAKIECAGAL